MIIRNLLVLAILMFNPAITYAQKTVKFNKITVENGLIQGNINHIAQDQKGFIWFATNGGVSRFDGIEFKSFLYSPNDSNTISNSIVSHLYIDNKDNIWIATQNGLDFYDTNQEIFLHYKSNPENANSISHNHITCVTADNIGNIWIGTDGGGLNRFNPSTKQFKAFRNSIDEMQTISSNRITCIEKDKYGFLWIGTADQGLNMLDPESEKFIRYSATGGLKNQLISSNQVSAVYEDNDGDLWVGTNAGLDLLKPGKYGRKPDEKDQVIQFDVSFLPKNNPATGGITSIFQGESGLIWFGTVNHGLGYLHKYQRFSGNYSVNPNYEFSLLSNNVTSVLDDRSGILWIGTNAGVNIINKLRNRFEWYKRVPGKENTLSSSNVYSILKQSNGTMWIGTYDRGLTKYEPLTDIYTTFLTDDHIIEGESMRARNDLFRKYDQRKTAYKAQKLYYLSHNRINTLLEESGSRIWIGTGGGGINILNTATGAISYVRHNPDDVNSISSDDISCIFKDSAGRIWIGTKDHGLNLFEKNNIRRFQADATNVFSISSNRIRSVVEDSNGTIWIGTFGGGLNKYDFTGNRFIHYQTTDHFPSSLAGNNIYTLYFEEPSSLWVGTTDGLSIYDIEEDSFTQLTTAEGLPSNTIYHIQKDNSGYVWVSSNKGLSRVHTGTLQIKNYDKEDGLMSTEFNPASGFIDNNGELFFGSINGYCSFLPENIVDNTIKPKVVFTDLIILNEKVKVNKPGSPLTKNISNTDTLVLSYKDISVSFEFVALNYTDSRKNQYAYILENFEDKWTYAGTRRFATYTNLEPGEYVFRVKASNNDGIWNEAGNSIFIIVKPPLWKTWWFYSILVSFVLALIVLVVQLRTRALHKSKVILEDQVRIRTRKINEQNTRLELANKEIIEQKNEIENQNLLLTKNQSEILKAKTDLDKINKELVDINTNLENKVEERTLTLKLMNDELINANNELDKFIYRASHDLKGPIARLLGISVLAKMDNKDEALREYIELIEKGAMDINKVLNKLNNIHFINKEINHSEIIDFPKLINGCEPGLMSYIEPGNLHITLRQEDEIQLRSDKNLMRIIIENLLENAVIFRKTSKADILVELKTTKKSIEISVTDHGLGIHKDQFDKIFDMFFRGSERSKGNGLGLYLVRKAVMKLQGQIEVDSEEGKYTRFTISLPKVIVPAELKSLVS